VQEENDSLMKVQREQEKALQALNKEGDYDKKIQELNEELRKQKEQLRKLQARYREEEKQMKVQHETLVGLEERCRKMVTLIKEKKKER
jgi:DNA repair ATPase RecN